MLFELLLLFSVPVVAKDAVQSDLVIGSVYLDGTTPFLYQEACILPKLNRVCLEIAEDGTRYVRCCDSCEKSISTNMCTVSRPEDYKLSRWYLAHDHEGCKLFGSHCYFPADSDVGSCVPALNGYPEAVPLSDECWRRCGYDSAVYEPDTGIILCACDVQ